MFFFYEFIIYIPNGIDLKKGEIIHIQGELVLPELSRNTGGFNYRRYLNSQKIYGSIFVDKYYIRDINNFNLIYYLQDEIYMSLSRLFPKDEMGLILGMMIGETKDISEDVMNSFRETGITHLVAVSGSNVMYVLVLVQFLFNKVIGKKNTYFVSIIFLIIFMLVSGASSSVIRATIMAILTIVANIFYLKSDTISNISLSALILMIINPLIIYDVGFVLSFGGTIGIVLLSGDFEKIFLKFGKISDTLSVTCSAQIILAPIMMYYFNTFSILSILTNLIVVPISGSITILGFIVFVISKIYFPLARILANCLYTLASFTIWVSQIFSKVPFSTIKVFTPNIVEIIFFYFIIFYLIGRFKIKTDRYNFISPNASKNFKKRMKISIVLIILLVSIELIYYNFPKNYIDIRCIDVGQGDAILVKTNKNKNILIDGGGSMTYDVGENILVPYLLDMRTTHIDAIFSSHSDEDHLNGILSAIENFSVGKIFIAKNAYGYDELYKLAKAKSIEICEVTKDDVIKIDDAIFKIIAPDRSIDDKDVNAYSLVFKLIYGDRSMLFTGDINQDTELKLQNVKSDILKVAHHGSNTSSGLAFLYKVKPKVSIIQVGKNNKYGHPNEEVLKRLKKFSDIYTTADWGEIKIRMYKNKVSIKCKLHYFLQQESSAY